MRPATAAFERQARLALRKRAAAMAPIPRSRQPQLGQRNHRCLALGTRRLEPNRDLRCAGFAYFGVLFLVVVMGIGLASVATVWRTAATREKELELLFVGGQFRAAIEDYYLASPGAPQLPATLQDLLEDKRFPHLRRHLRRIYVDPITGRDDWGLQRAGDAGGIVGVYSLSEATPVKQDNFDAVYVSFSQAKRYRDWIFAFQAATQAGAGQPQLAGSAPTLAAAPLEPMAVTTGAAAAPPSARSSEATRQARERMCQSSRRADLDNCRIAQIHNGAAVRGRCDASIALRYQACLDPDSSALVPLDTGTQ
jgi:type II secretory pathway pseudopilin PulG